MTSLLPRRSILLLPTLLVGATAACARGGDDEYFMTGWYQGSLPLEERQTIEDYQKTVEPALGEYVAAAAEFSGTPYIISESHLSKGINGYEMYTASVNFENPIDYARACRLLLDMFTPLGFEKTAERKDLLEILDRRNGGYIHFTDNPEPSGMTIFGISGDRPTSTGDPQAHRVRPDWELAIPLIPGKFPTASTEPRETAEPYTPYTPQTP